MAILPLQLARVSNLLQSSVTTSALTSTQQQLLEIQNQLSTGKKLISPSDNPGDSAIAQQIHKLLEQRDAYASNLKSASNQLSEVDTTLGDLSDLVQQAQDLASANVGSDVSQDARTSAAAVVDALYSQLLSLGNTQFEGSYLFAGDRSTDAPFVETNGTIQYVGSSDVLKNRVDEQTNVAFQVDGADVFNAVSSRVQGSADLTPAINATTRVQDLRGALGHDIKLGSIQIGDGTTNKLVDLSACSSVGDLITTINNAAVGNVVASVSPDGLGIQLTAGAGDNISVSEVGGGMTAANLGILNAGGAGAGNPIVGASLEATVTPLTSLANLRGGAGLDTTGLIITNGQTSKTIDLSGATTVEDLLNAINSAGLAVRAEINSSGTGINIFNPDQTHTMTIAENGGDTAEQLGVRSFDANTPLSALNGGQGVKTVDGDDFSITDSAGVSFNVDLTSDSGETVQDVIDAINTAATAAGAGVTASFATSGNGIVLTDTAAGAGTLSLTSQNFSTAAANLGLTGSAVAGVITGADVNAVAPQGIFTHVSELRDALRSGDQQAITAAATGLKEDYDRVVRVRGENGAQVKAIENRQQHLDDQNVATKALLSSLEDVDFTEAIAKFQTLQTSLQAALQTSGKILSMSLLDFIS